MEGERDWGYSMWDTVCFQGISHILFQSPQAQSLSRLYFSEEGVEDRHPKQRQENTMMTEITVHVIFWDKYVPQGDSLNNSTRVLFSLTASRMLQGINQDSV